MTTHPEFSTRVLTPEEIADISAHVRTGDLMENFMKYMTVVGDAQCRGPAAVNLKALNLEVSSDLLKVIPR